MRAIGYIKLVLLKHMHTHGEKCVKVSIIVATPVKLDKPGAQFVNWASA